MAPLTCAHAPGATPLRPEDVKRLRPQLRWVETFEQLNPLEAANIAECERWAQTSRIFKLPVFLATTRIARVHKAMFKDVWLWAGRIWADATYWFEQGAFAPDEFAVRLHHRLVKVHPFANGNGRHARLVADLLLQRHFGVDRLRWGGTSLGEEGLRRQTYVSALNRADRGDYQALLAFCRAS